MCFFKVVVDYMMLVGVGEWVLGVGLFFLFLKCLIGY
jgi:hypothetical protein